ncbi:MAG: A24 family peptidase C-terminal domain-containing protein [Desulfurococcaceae archaeon]
MSCETLLSETLLEAVKVLVSLVFLVVLGYYDMRSRLLPDVLVYTYAGVSTVVFTFTLFNIFRCYSPTVLAIYVLFSTALTTGLLYALYKMGHAGDGDVYVMLSIGLSHSFPSVYRVVLLGYGLLPPGLVILLYACIVQLIVLVYQALVNITKYRSVVKDLKGVYKLIVPLISKPVKIKDYVSSPREHVHPIQCPEVYENEVKWFFRLTSRIDEEDCILKFKDELVNRMGDMYIWVSPKIPFVFYMMIGFVIFILLGDYAVLVALRTLVPS